MKKRQNIIMLLAGVLIISSHAYADQGKYHEPFELYHHWLEEKQEQQERRIRHGISQGLLSHRELDKLRHEQHRIAGLICQYEQDGYFSRWEKWRLHEKLEHADEYIYRFKHNRVYANYSQPSQGYHHQGYQNDRWRWHGNYFVQW